MRADRRGDPWTTSLWTTALSQGSIRKRTNRIGLFSIHISSETFKNLSCPDVTVSRTNPSRPFFARGMKTPATPRSTTTTRRAPEIGAKNISRVVRTWFASRLVCLLYYKHRIKVVSPNYITSHARTYYEVLRNIKDRLSTGHHTRVRAVLWYLLIRLE